MQMFLDYLKWIRSPGSVPLSILPSPPLHHPLILCFIFCPTALSTTSLTTIFLPDLKRKHFFLRASLVAEWFKKKKKKNLPVSSGDAGSMSLSEQSPRGRHGSPPQYSCLGNPMDREPGGLQSMGLQRVRHDLAIKQYFFSLRMYPFHRVTVEKGSKHFFLPCRLSHAMKSARLWGA